MTGKNTEILVGLFVALGFAALLMLAMKVSNLAELSGDGGYEVTARFDNIGGLKVRSPVTMAGAAVTLTISPDHARIPTDTSASIYTAGLLGEQYVALLPGGEEKFLEEGSEIRLTQSAVVLEELIGQFLYSQGQSDSGKGGSTF